MEPLKGGKESGMTGFIRGVKGGVKGISLSFFLLCMCAF